MRKVNDAPFSGPQFSVLSESQIKDIHLASLEVLRRTGVRFEHKEALKLLKNGGAFITDGNLVRFPPDMVDQKTQSDNGQLLLRRKCEGRYWDYDEDGKKDIFNYIEMFYNRKRRHKTLGYVSPVVYEEMYEMKQEQVA